MKCLFKKYWTHFISISIILNLIFSVTIFKNLDISNIVFILLLMFIGLLVIGVWGEIIYCIILTCKNKEINNKVGKILMIYCFNMLYIPCFYLRYVYKDKNYKVKNVLFLICILSLFITFGVLYKNNDSVNVDDEVIISSMRYNFFTKDKKIIVNVSGNYSQIDSDNFDLYLKGKISYFKIFGYDNEGISADEIINLQKNQIEEKGTNLKLLDRNSSTYSDRIIVNYVYEYNRKYNNIIMLSTVEFINKNYIVYVLQNVESKYYNIVKDEFENNVQNIKMHKNSY